MTHQVSTLSHDSMYKYDFSDEWFLRHSSPGRARADADESRGRRSSRARTANGARRETFLRARRVSRVTPAEESTTFVGFDRLRSNALVTHRATSTSKTLVDGARRQNSSLWFDRYRLLSRDCRTRPMTPLYFNTELAQTRSPQRKESSRTTQRPKRPPR